MSEAEGPRQVTREELYEMVWARSIHSLAPELGISGRGLAKLCKRYLIPTPPVGHWRKVERGKKVKRPPLPKVPKDVQRVIQLPQRARDDGVMRAGGYPIHDPTIAEQVQWEKECCSDPSEEKLPRLRAYRLQPLETSKSVRSKAREIAEMVTRACVQRGYHIEDNSVEVFGEPVKFSLCEIDARVYSGESPGRKHEWRLAVTLVAGRKQRQWTDTKHRPLLGRLREIMIGMLFLADNVREERRQKEQRELEERQRQEERKRRKIENLWLDRRDRLLTDSVNRWRLARDLREFLAACEAEAARRGIDTQGDSELAAWLAGARAVAERTDPLKGANAFDQFRWKMPPDFGESIRDRRDSWDDEEEEDWEDENWEEEDDWEEEEDDYWDDFD